jgi:biopolymer transport protein ExbD
MRTRTAEGEAFDMTPVIDVVFLLIIFFMLVCQFIVADRYKVEVPEEISAAVPQRDDERHLTLTVMPDAGGGHFMAAGNERLSIDNAEDIAALFVSVIDEHFRTAPSGESRTVRLRCDRSVTFGQVRPVLEGLPKVLLPMWTGQCGTIKCGVHRRESFAARGFVLDFRGFFR